MSERGSVREAMHDGVQVGLHELFVEVDLVERESDWVEDNVEVVEACDLGEEGQEGQLQERDLRARRNLGEKRAVFGSEEWAGRRRCATMGRKIAPAANSLPETGLSGISPDVFVSSAHSSTREAVDMLFLPPLISKKPV